jgi:hypothetical protein
MTTPSEIRIPEWSRRRIIARSFRSVLWNLRVDLAERIDRPQELFDLDVGEGKRRDVPYPFSPEIQSLKAFTS